MQRVMKIMSAADKYEDKELPQEPKTIKLEFFKYKDRFYAHSIEDGAFMASGDSKAELVAILNKRFPNISFTANPQNLKEVNLE